MSQFATITTTHRVIVWIPADVFARFRGTPEFNMVVRNSRSWMIRSGPDWDSADQWGESEVRYKCEDFANYWHNWILQWQARLRDETVLGRRKSTP